MPASHFWKLADDKEDGHPALHGLPEALYGVIYRFRLLATSGTQPTITAAARILSGVSLALTRGDIETLRRWERPCYDYLKEAPDKDPFHHFPIAPRAGLDRKHSIAYLLWIAEALSKEDDWAYGLARLYWQDDDEQMKCAAQATFSELAAHAMCAAVRVAFFNLTRNGFWEDETEREIEKGIAQAREDLAVRKRARKYVVVTLRAFGVKKTEVDDWLKGVADERS
jgi:hypothetical protein